MQSFRMRYFNWVKKNDFLMGIEVFKSSKQYYATKIGFV